MLDIDKTVRKAVRGWEEVEGWRKAILRTENDEKQMQSNRERMEGYNLG